jgi:hypothetical protein
MLAQDFAVNSLIQQLASDPSASAGEVEERRVQACKTLGDIARDDQHKALSKFFSERKLLVQLAACARSSNETLQFEALRVWWNLSFNDQKAQTVTMEHLGVKLLASLLGTPNASLQLRAIGLIWNLTQHSIDARRVFVEAGVLQMLGTTLHRTVTEVTSSASPAWGVLQLLFGALANLALTCSDRVKKHNAIVQAGELMVGMDLVTPPIVQQQATRFVCNLISDGSVDHQWQENGYSYRTSAPREAIEVA